MSILVGVGGSGYDQTQLSFLRERTFLRVECSVLHCMCSTEDYQCHQINAYLGREGGS